MHCLQNMDIFTLILLTLCPKLGPDCGNGDGDGKKFGGDGKHCLRGRAGMEKTLRGRVGMESKVAGTGGDGCKLSSPCSSLV